jgi:hypothetical protein
MTQAGPRVRARGANGRRPGAPPPHPLPLAFSPARRWNEVVELFGSNEDVSFGDVNLSRNQVRTSHGEPQSPGAGGWPTIRYFNKETG